MFSKNLIYEPPSEQVSLWKMEPVSLRQIVPAFIMELPSLWAQQLNKSAATGMCKPRACVSLAAAHI